MSKTYINGSGKQVLHYDSPDSVLLDLPFILTSSKKLTINMPYMLLEGNKTKAIRLLDVRDEGGFVYLIVQNLQTQKTFELSWNLSYTGSYWLWSLADLQTLSSLTK